MNKNDHLIWSDYHLDYDDWKDDLEDEFPDMTDDERMQMMYERNNSYLDDERCNLNIQMAMPIIVIGDLGLWNGRRTGYKDVPAAISGTASIPIRTTPHGMWTALETSAVMPSITMAPTITSIGHSSPVSAKRRWTG